MKAPALIAIMILAPACASPEPPRPAAPHDEAPRPAPSAAPLPAVDAGSAGRAPNPGAAPPAVATRTFSQSYPDERRVAPAEWLKSHGAKGGISDKDCWDLGPSVGVPASAALLCVHTQGPPVEKLARIYRLDGTRVRRVWQATVGTHANWLELTPVLAADGTTLELLERSPGDCARAICHYLEKELAGILMDFGSVLQRGCKQRGVYAYQGQGFALTQPAESPQVELPYSGAGCKD